MNFMSSVVNFFKDGGLFLYPLALIFVVGVSIAIERFVYLTRETIRNRTLWDNLVPALSSGNFKQVVALTQNSKASIATILNYGVARVASARRRDDIEKAMDESLLEVIPRIEKRTHYPVIARQRRPADRLARHHHRLDRRVQRGGDREPGGKSQPARRRDLGGDEQYRLGPRRRDHAAARAHVPRVEDHLADRQPGDRLGQIPELDHRASARRPASPQAPAAAPRARSRRGPRHHLGIDGMADRATDAEIMKSKSAQPGPAQSRPLSPAAATI